MPQVKYKIDSGVKIDDFEVTSAGAVSTASNITGTLIGNVTGNVTGNVNGNITGNVTGNLLGDVTGNITGNIYGDVYSQDKSTLILNNGTDGSDAELTVESLEITGTSHVLVPAGTTAQRPISPQAGYLRYNTDLATFEGYNGSQWSGVGGGNPWTTKTSNYTAINNDRLFVDTSIGAVTITLPASPAVGDQIRMIDVSGSFNTNNLTIGRNSKKIMGLSENMTVSENFASIGLVYSGETRGWLLLEA